MGDPLQGFAGARSTLGGGGNAPMPTGPAHNENGTDWIEGKLADDLMRSMRVA